MIVQSLRLSEYRNFESLTLNFSPGTNIFYGENAQGKTNILEALYVTATTKSHRGVHDSDLIRFGYQEGHIQTVLIKDGLDYKIDIHLRQGKTKGIAINGKKVKKASSFVGLLHVVFFSPEDLSIVKSGPSMRRKFLDTELCQLDESYLYNLTQYNKTIEQRNHLLKQIIDEPSLSSTMDIWNDQLVLYGEKVIHRRKEFIEEMNQIIGTEQKKLSGGKEEVILQYLPDVEENQFATKLDTWKEREKYIGSTAIGPQKDDFSFLCNGIDMRKFGSQGQQRTCALALKLSELMLVQSAIGDHPVLMMDDVLSELDTRRQNDLLASLGGIQTMITCTGLDEFVSGRLAIDRLFHVENGTVKEQSAKIGLT